MLRTVSKKIPLGGLAAAGVHAVGIAVPTIALAKDGKLTQEQADAITAAPDAGVLPGFGGHGHGGPDAQPQ
jgi:hypothetical protein